MLETAAEEAVPGDFFLTRSLDRKLERKRVASQGLGLFFFFSFSIKRIFHRIENTVGVTQAHSYLLLFP